MAAFENIKLIKPAVLTKKFILAEINSCAVQRITSSQRKLRQDGSKVVFQTLKEASTKQKELPVLTSSKRHERRVSGMLSSNHKAGPLFLINNVSITDSKKNDTYRRNLLKTVKRLELLL